MEYFIPAMLIISTGILFYAIYLTIINNDWSFNRGVAMGASATGNTLRSAAFSRFRIRKIKGMGFVPEVFNRTTKIWNTIQHNGSLGPISDRILDGVSEMGNSNTSIFSQVVDNAHRSIANYCALQDSPVIWKQN